MLLLSGMLLCGCSSVKKAGKSSSTTTTSSTEAETTQTTTAPVTTTISESLPIDRELKPAEGTYIYDNANILPTDTISECNDYAEFLYENYLINTAVVTVDDLNGSTPEEYAADSYKKIYDDKGSGLLLLINNDTDRDILFRSGRCETYISDDDRSTAFYQATKEIVSGDYKTAIMRLLQLGEKCPVHFFDNSGVFPVDQAAAIENSLKEKSAGVSVLVTSNTTDTPNAEILKTYYERRYKDEKGFMIMLDTDSSTVLVYPESGLPGGYESTLKKACDNAEKGDLAAAVISAAEPFK